MSQLLCKSSATDYRNSNIVIMHHCYIQDEIWIKYVVIKKPQRVCSKNLDTTKVFQKYNINV